MLRCRLQNRALEYLAEKVELFQLTSSCQRSFNKTQDVGEQRTTAMVIVLGTSLVMPTRFLLAGQTKVSINGHHAKKPLGSAGHTWEV